VRNLLQVKNYVIQPICLRDEIVGCVVAGNPLDNFIFSVEDSKTIELFAHNMSIIWEHERLYRKVANLEIVDPLMNIYNDKFFFKRLDEEINRAVAYQRPCSLLVLEITNYHDYRDNLNIIEVERILKNVANIFKSQVRSIDILGRIKDNRIAVILIESNKRQSHYTGTKLKTTVEDFLKEATPFVPCVSIALAENPVDGANASELYTCIITELGQK
jgi:diguanylate cyclase (GGDEF)-like protein